MLPRHNTEVAAMARKLAATVQLKLRFPERLRRQIEQAAERNRQSMNTEIIERLERSFEKVDDQARDRELVKEAVTATLSELDWERHESARLREWQEEWERRLTVLDNLHEQAREQASAATNEETKSQEAGVVSLMDKAREQLLREQVKRQSSAATNKETKNRTGTENKP
jgi:hypothetical protein